MGLSVRDEAFGVSRQPPHLEAPRLRIQPTVDRKHSPPPPKKMSRKLTPKPEYTYLHSVHAVLGILSNLEMI